MKRRQPRSRLTDTHFPYTTLFRSITARHRPAWERAADDARALLRERRLSDIQRHALATEINRLTTVIDAIGPAPPEANPGCRRQPCAGRRAGATALPSSASPRPYGCASALVPGDRKSVGRGGEVSVRVDRGGRRIYQNKK